MTKDHMYKEAKSLLLNMPPCVDGNYQFACVSCSAQALAVWAERIYQQGIEDASKVVPA